MKDKYLNEIKERLLDYQITDVELSDIISDYDQMYEDALAKGLEHTAIVDYLGTPERIVTDLSENYTLKSEIRGRKDNRIVALMPFISTVAFFLLGFLLGAWHPGWLVFLLIPVVAILVNERKRVLTTLTALSPFMAVVAFILIGQYAGAWNPGWLVFFIIPVFGVLTSGKFWKSFGFIAVLLLCIGVYLFAGYTYDMWGQAAFVFILLLGYSVLTSDIQILTSFTRKNGGIWIWITALGTLIIFFLFGFLFDTWAYLWMLFLLIPMVAIITNVKDRNKFVALMPFIATIIFFSLGFFLGLWASSWMAFLLIPMVAIIINVKEKNKIVALMPFIATIIFFSLGFFLGLWAFSWMAFLLIPVTAIIINA